MIPDPAHARPLRWVLLTLLAILVLGGYAHAQNHPDGPFPRGDSIEMQMVSETEGIIEYFNGDRMSHHFQVPDTVQDSEGIGPVVEIELQTTGGPETLWAYPPPGWVAIPPFIEVADGSSDRIRIVAGDWDGM